MPKVRWFLKLPVAAAICFVPAVMLTMLLVSIYFWNTVNAGCDCYSTKMSLSAVAFQNSVPIIKLILGGVLVILTLLLSVVPWTKARIFALVGASLLALLIWVSYGDQPYTHEYYKRWTMVPIDRITVAMTAGYSEVVSVTARRRFVAALSGFLVVILGVEIVGVLRSNGKRKEVNTLAEVAPVTPENSSADHTT